MTTSPPTSSTLSEKTPIKVRILPTHQPSRWGCFTTQGNYRHSETTGHKGKEYWTQPAKRSPGRPISGKVVKLWLECCSTVTEGKKHTKSHTYMPKHFPSSLTSAWLCLWQGGRLPQPALFKAKPGAFLPSQGNLWDTQYIQSEGEQSGPHRYTGLSQRSYST